MKALFIAEKPSLRRAIENVYNEYKNEIPYDITFMEQRGHLITLMNPSELDEDLKNWTWDNLPIHPEEYGGWKYKLIKEPKQGKFLTAEERYKAIKQEIKSGNYDFIINAGDPDQEGELLIRIVIEAIGTDLPIKRYWSNDTTKPKILEALKNLRDDRTDPMLVNLLQAAYARQHSDYRFGMNVSRAVSLKMNTKIACGRVKTPMMSIICKREDEIANFVPKTVYGVKVLYEDNFSGQLFNDSVEDKEDKEGEVSGVVWFDDIEDARDVINSLSDEAKVISFEKNRVESYAPSLFKLATAQISAGKMGYSANDTLAIIQSLYEKGYMSYPRTDCEYISSNENLVYMLKSAESVPSLKPFIEKIDKSIIAKVRNTKKWVNDKELTKSGHSALCPTTKVPVFEDLTKEEQDIYEMICRQFVAIFLPPLVQNKVSLVTDIDGNTFKSTGKTLIDKGYSEIFGNDFIDNEIPEYKEGDVIAVDDYEVAEKTSMPPKRFSEADLIAACENPLKFLNDEKLKELGKKLKIGTPATRASILEELLTKNKYLQREKIKNKTYITPTNLGKLIYNNLQNCDICKVDMTGEWEEKLEMIRNGEVNIDTIEKQMKDAVTEMLVEIKNTPMNALTASNDNTEVCQCPKCDGVIKMGPKSFYCSNWEEKNGACKVKGYKKICDSLLTPKEVSNLLSGEEITKTLKKDQKSWNQRLKYNFDTFELEFVKEETKESEYLCPNCNSSLKENSMKFECSNGCGFTFWKTAGKKMLTSSQIDNFFTKGDTGLVKGLKSKTGNTFEAHIVLKGDKSGSMYKFED